MTALVAIGSWMTTYERQAFLARIQNTPWLSLWKTSSVAIIRWHSARALSAKQTAVLDRLLARTVEHGVYS